MIFTGPSTDASTQPVAAKRAAAARAPGAGKPGTATSASTGDDDTIETVEEGSGLP